MLCTAQDAATLPLNTIGTDHQRAGDMNGAAFIDNRKVIMHNGDPVLAWTISNVVMESDANANIKSNKKKAANKIDPAIAALMPFGTWQIEHKDFAFDMSSTHKKRLNYFTGV